MAVTTKVTSFSIDVEIEEKLNQYIEATDLKKSTVVNKALRAFFEQEKLPRKKNQN